MKYIYTSFIFFLLVSNLNAKTINEELGKKALKTIVTEIRNSDSDIRMLSCDILGKIGNKAAVKLLKNRLNDVSKHVQISAAEALYTLGDKSALKTILNLINDVPGKKPIANTALLQMKVISRNKIREKAIEAVVRILEENSMDLLYSLKSDSYGIIRDAAASIEPRNLRSWRGAPTMASDIETSGTINTANITLATSSLERAFIEITFLGLNVRPAIKLGPGVFPCGSTPYLCRRQRTANPTSPLGMVRWNVLVQIILVS